MYCYDFICTYKMIEDDEEFSNQLYQQQLLDAFNLTSYDNNKISTSISVIYNSLSKDSRLIQILELIKNKFPQLCSDQQDAIAILFTYDYFYLFHRCLIDYYMNAKIDDKYYDSLSNAITVK